MTKRESPIRVAVCEDNDDLRDILVSMLPRHGLRVFGVASAEALDRLLAEREIDLVLLDIGLPGEDGLSAAVRLRRDRPQLGIAMLTARDLIEDRIRGLNQGADMYFVKPVDMGELAAALGSLYRRLVPPTSKAPVPWRLLEGRGVLKSPLGRSIELSLGERRLLGRLMGVPGVTVEREDLALALGWPPGDKNQPRLATILSRLRAKIALATPEEAFPLRTQHGSGFVFLAEECSAP